MSVQDRDMGWQRIMTQLQSAGDPYTVVGLFGHGGTPEDDVAARGAVQEYGSEKAKIPPRPFMRRTFEANEQKIGRVKAAIFAEVLAGRRTLKSGLGRLGEWYVRKIQETIKTGKFTPLSLSTIRAKKSSKPLIDTGQMVNAVQHKETD